MCVLSEVCSTKTMSFDAARILIPFAVAGDGGACARTTLATLDALPHVLPNLAIHTHDQLYHYFLKP